MKTETMVSPGPWKVNLNRTGRYPSNDFLLCITTADETENVGLVYCSPVAETGHANARLIAAAPELMNALKDLLDTVTRIGPPKITKGGLCEENDWHYDTRKAAAAIQKASG